MSISGRQGRVTSPVGGVFYWEIQDFEISYENEFRVRSPPFEYSGVDYRLFLQKVKQSYLILTTFRRPVLNPFPRSTLEFRLTSGDESVSPSYILKTTGGTSYPITCCLDVGEYFLLRGKDSVQFPAFALHLRIDDEPERRFVSCAIQADIPDSPPRDAIALTKLQDDLKKLVLSEEDSDVAIKVQGEEFPAHKTILRARSPVLRAMFEHNMEEKLSGGVSIEDCDPKTFPDFLNYLYTGSTNHVGGGNVCQLYTVSDKYEVFDLKAHCAEFMKTHMSTETFCDILALALKHEEGDLISVATKFFCDNAVEIGKSVKWQIFHQNNHTVTNELFLKALSRGKTV